VLGTEYPHWDAISEDDLNTLSARIGKELATQILTINGARALGLEVTANA
jgi:hypothetical protein